jgi:hypothetical protein
MVIKADSWNTLLQMAEEPAERFRNLFVWPRLLPVMGDATPIRIYAALRITWTIQQMAKTSLGADKKRVTVLNS